MADKTPHDLLDELSKPGDHNDKLRADIRDRPKETLAGYGVTVDDALLDPPRNPPPPKKVKAALDWLEATDESAAYGSDAWKTYALLVVVIGAIPFVAADAR